MLTFTWRGGGAIWSDTLECDICNDWYLWNRGLDVGRDEWLALVTDEERQAMIGPLWFWE